MGTLNAGSDKAMPGKANADKAIREATDRLVQAHVAGVRPEDDLALNAWRRENGTHEAAFQLATQTWQDIAAMRGTASYADLMGPPTWRERWVAFRQSFRIAGTPAWLRPGVALTCALALLAVGVWSYLSLGHQVHRTGISEVREIRLDDGSRVSLGAHSALDIEFTPSVRRVRLEGGEAFFDVARELGRPFEVLAGDTLIRVVGTRFNVNLNPARALVEVEEGVVEVRRAETGTARDLASHPAPVLRLAAHQQVLVEHRMQAPLVIEPLHGAAVGSWREGRLSYRGASLAEIVADANRYRSGEIRIADPAVGAQYITTSFRTNQIEQMLDSLPVAVLRRPDGSVDLEAPPANRQ